MAAATRYPRRSAEGAESVNRRTTELARAGMPHRDRLPALREIAMPVTTHASLFTGIGGFDLGFELAGITTIAQCEIDDHARTVLAHHFPEVTCYHDITKLDGRDLRGVDIISGGFPCQDLSVAGKRAGLSGARSGLFFQLARVVEEARPRLLVWENVSGLLSDDLGNSMRTVCGELASIGYFGAWRVLDSQFHGVPQRRRRVFGAFASGDSGG